MYPTARHPGDFLTLRFHSKGYTVSNLLKLLAALAVFVVSANVSATPILDQNQPGYDNPMAAFNQTDLAQSFQQTHNSISGAGIHMYAGFGTTDTVTIALWDALPNQPGATLLTSASGTATAGSWFDVFWAPYTVTPGATYYLVFTSANNTMAIDGSTSNPYANGQTFANPGFGSFATFDYTFRTWYDGVVSSVPEPSPLGLLGLGMAATLILVAVRRRARVA